MDQGVASFEVQLNSIELFREEFGLNVIHGFLNSKQPMSLMISTPMYMFEREVKWNKPQ
jgi:hypothetical protein